MMKRNIRLALVASTLLLGVSGAANASFTISALVGGAPTGVSYVNFNNLALGGAGGTSGGVTVAIVPDGKTVTGSVGGEYAAPYISNSNGALFGDVMVSGQDTTRYLTTGLGSVSLRFPGLEQYMGLLWGSVDDYNHLAFYSGEDLIGTIDGLQVHALANGNQGAAGTFYVNINSTVAFDRVVASSTSYAFEFDNVAFNPTQVPEPIGLGLLGLGIAALGLSRRRKGTTLSSGTI